MVRVFAPSVFRHRSVGLVPRSAAMLWRAAIAPASAILASAAGRNSRAQRMWQCYR
jgi:hypothetical protein